jgi:hypothetical protein
MALTQFLDAPGIDVKTNRPACPAESHGNRQTDIPQTDDGNLSFHSFFAPFLNFRI